jgi:hypothetical protein
LLAIINYPFCKTTRKTIAKINNNVPNEYIDHLRTFLIPRSLETLNKSKSLLPTSAPLKLFESGANKKETNISAKEIKIKIIIIAKDAVLIFIPFYFLFFYFVI